MSLISGFEQRLERAVEGFFTRLFKSGVHPVEIGKRVLRVMEDGKTVALRRAYVPNIYEITVGPKDFERLSGVESKLVEELEVFVGEAARQRDWALADSPRVGFVVDDGLSAGEFRVAAQAVSVGDDAEEPKPRRRTQDTDEPLGTPCLLLLAEGNPIKTLEVTDVITIGRQPDNDLVVADRSVSRHHAEVTNDDGVCRIDDLGSTNGTKVNGKKVSSHELVDGDQISFGSTIVEFRRS